MSASAAVSAAASEPVDIGPQGQCFSETVVLCGYCEKKLFARTLYSHWRTCVDKAKRDGCLEAVEEKKAKQQVSGRACGFCAWRLGGLLNVCSGCCQEISGKR